MAKLEWDKSGERLFETGVNKGVLYVQEGTAYPNGVAWNGLTAVTESPSGAEATALYADDIKYLNLTSAEEFGGTIEAYMYPDEFKACSGETDLVAGVSIGQQARKPFGFCYRTELGTDANEQAGYKLHLVYNCKVQPSSRSHATKSENVDPDEMSWDYSSTPVPVTGVTGVEQTSVVEVKSTDFTQAQMTALENVLYGVAATTGTNATAAVAASLPAPGRVYEILTEAASSGG